MRNKLIDKILKIKEMSKEAEAVISVIMKYELKLECINEVRGYTELGPVLFRRAIDELVELNILKWIQQRTCKGEIRNKGMLYGSELAALGIRQIDKKYRSIEQEEKPKKSLREREVLAKNTALISPENLAHRGYKSPHVPQGSSKKLDESLYYITHTPGLKERFLNKTKSSNKIPTAHLHRKCHALFKEKG